MMDYRLERKLLQICILAGAGVPLLAGGSGMIFGTSMFGDMSDLSSDSHFRYLSGLLFGIGVAFLHAIPTIERRTAYVRLLSAIVFTGGISRLAACLFVGVPELPMVLAIVMELVVTPLLCFWQARIAKRAPQS